jgi:hypothetical protein
MAGNLNSGGHCQTKSAGHSGNHESRDQLTSQ